MKKYTITVKVIREIYTDYFIEANSEEEAKEKLIDNDVEGSETTEDISEEEIIDINEYKKEDTQKVKDYVSHMILSSFEDLAKARDLYTNDISPDDDEKVVKIMEELEEIYKNYIEYNSVRKEI